MLDWLILGGGVHGTLISRALVGEAGCDPDRVRVLDPHPEPLQRWAECTANIGMDYLRSSLVHHLDEAPLSLERFSRGRRDAALLRDLSGQFLLTRRIVEPFQGTPPSQGQTQGLL